MSVPEDEPAAPPYVLTRAALQDGSLLSSVVKSYPEMRILTEEERAASLAAVLRDRPDRGDGVWLFAYGSLIWNPLIQFAERRVARIEGWHRAFCLSTSAGRGSLDNPGLVLGLEAGGSCLGVALRIAEEAAVAELALLWRREMLTGAYQPHWVALMDEQGRSFGVGLAFTINREGEHYVGDLPHAEIVRRLATASGSLGSAADYLFRTCDGLRLCGIPDTDLERLADEVRVQRAL